MKPLNYVLAQSRFADLVNSKLYRGGKYVSCKELLCED